MPTVTTQRWVTDGLAIAKYLDNMGYRSELQYADDNVATQISQIDAMLSHGAKLLVVAPIDGKQLGVILKKAADKNVKVISYDRLIRDSANVDYYATFDNYYVGVLQGTDIVKRLGLGTGKGPFKIEIFAGDPDDNNSTFFYNGAMAQLKPYINQGRLVVGSGQVSFESVSTPRWNGANARIRLEKVLERFYINQRLDAVLAPNDGIAVELIVALKNAGYGLGSKQAMPVITGQDADMQSVRSIIRREQTSTVFKDTRVLAQVTATMADAILSGKSPKINDEKTYHNGVKLVPSHLLQPVGVDLDNWRTLLVDSGYYKAHKLK